MTNDTVGTKELKRLVREHGTRRPYYAGMPHSELEQMAPALAEEVLAIRAEFDDVMKEWAEFRQEIRGHLFAFWPNNPGVGDGEIVDAVRRIAEQHEAGRERDIATRKALERISRGSRNAALPSVVALLAANARNVVLGAWG